MHHSSFHLSFKAYLDGLVQKYEQPAFITEDPISIPHGFDHPLDQEIIGLYSALLAWGQRKTVLKKLEELCERMDFKPRAFVYNFDFERDQHHLDGFKHRTFQPIDAMWLTNNLSLILRKYKSIEGATTGFHHSADEHAGNAIQGLSDLLFSIDAGTPPRLRKHLARPSTGSACKRLCLYLRWMVRSGPVDLGIWSSIRPDQLVLPLDVHSARQARILGMLSRTQNDWRAALQLTANCKTLCSNDPSRYDYAFFGSGVYGDTLKSDFYTQRQSDQKDS